MKRDSIKKRRYLDRLKENDPGKYDDLKYRKYRSSAKSFILKKMREEDITYFEKYIQERKLFFKNKNIEK